MKDDDAPPGVTDWIGALTGDLSWDAVVSRLSTEIVFELGGRRTRGRAAVLERMRQRPNAQLARAIWVCLPGATPHHLIMRGAIAGGHIDSRGGPMAAIDFAFTLDSVGLITQVSLTPHHLEPQYLPPPLALGSLAPSFTLPDAYGETISLDRDTAQATLIVFTANHCPWALGWHERIQRVARDYSARGVKVLQINPNDAKLSPFDSIERSRERVAAGEFAGLLLMDKSQTVARAWGARHTPESFILDSRGRVRYHGAPDCDSEDQSQDARWIRAALDAVLAGRDVECAQTTPLGCTIKWTL